MSFSIPESFVEQFSSNVHMLAEQQTSRLRGTVDVMSVTGDSFKVERLGGHDDVNTVTERHGDTPLNELDHTARWGYPATYDVADLLDKADQPRMLIDVKSKYTRRHASAMGRKIDDEIIRALGASAPQGRTNPSGVALPSAQKVASGSTGLTVDKLIEAKRILDAAEIDDYLSRTFILSSREISQLLAETKVTSQDFNTVKALVKGEINEYLGFKFIRTERLADDGTDRFCYAYAMEAVTLGFSQEPTSRASERDDKRYAWQVYTWMQLGGVRVEDEQVVQVAATMPS